MDWWIEHRRKSYYDTNSLDLAALTAELQASGNERAQLITTHGKREGYATGTSPHSWSFIDDTDLAERFVQQSRV